MHLAIKIYSKKECHLCDVAKEVLGRFAKRYPLQIQEIDIEQDPNAFALYQYEIPVIFLEDIKLFKYKIDETKFRKAIERRLASGEN